jgi:hypothetical protein
LSEEHPLPIGWVFAHELRLWKGRARLICCSLAKVRGVQGTNDGKTDGMDDIARCVAIGRRGV